MRWLVDVWVIHLSAPLPSPSTGEGGIPTRIQVVRECDQTGYRSSSLGTRMFTARPHVNACLTSTDGMHHPRIAELSKTQSRGNVQCCLVLRNLRRKTEDASVSGYCNLNRLTTGIKKPKIWTGIKNPKI